MDNNINQYLSFKEQEEIREVEEMIAKKYEHYFQSLPLENVFIFNRLKTGLKKAKKETIKDAYYFCNKVILTYGFILPKKYSLNSSIRFWVLIYYMSSKYGLDLKKRYLNELKKVLKDNPRLLTLYAFLYDKIKVKEGQKQRYGSDVKHTINFGVEDLKSLKDRQKAMNLLQSNLI